MGLDEFPEESSDVHKFLDLLLLDQDEVSDAVDFYLLQEQLKVLQLDSVRHS